MIKCECSTELRSSHSAWTGIRINMSEFTDIRISVAIQPKWCAVSSNFNLPAPALASDEKTFNKVVNKFTSSWKLNVTAFLTLSLHLAHTGNKSSFSHSLATYYAIAHTARPNRLLSHSPFLWKSQDWFPTDLLVGLVLTFGFGLTDLLAGLRWGSS